MYYKDAQGQWQPVSGADKYGVEKAGLTEAIWHTVGYRRTPSAEEQNIKKFIDEVKFHNGDKHI